MSRNTIPPYYARIDGRWTTQDRMFSRADMAFWGVGAQDIMPPPGYDLIFDLATCEPEFRPAEAKNG